MHRCLCIGAWVLHHGRPDLPCCNGTSFVAAALAPCPVSEPLLRGAPCLMYVIDNAVVYRALGPEDGVR